MPSRHHADSTLDGAANRAKVVLVEDDRGCREVYSRLLAYAGHRVLPYSAAPDFLADELAHDCDCIVVDLRMPEMDGLQMLEAYQQRYNRLPPAIVVTGDGDVSSAVNAMKLGAIDFIEKPVSARDLRRLVAAAVEQSRQQRRANGIAEKLTPREQEILEHVLGGETSKQIADKLGISPRTVEEHRARILQKAGAANTAELVKLAMSAAPAPETRPRA